ncbi:MAG: DUF790 family protein [Myxococcota bacterium]|jgi:predicted nuclease of restriction endonuclease-like RecB superfamily|nr:DUF790 family protein [Myxococcota bacterium]
MLPSSHVSASRRLDRIYPRYVRTDDPKMQALAEQLITCWNAHVGRSWGELSEALSELEGDSPQFRLTRALALLLKRAVELESQSEIDPVALRELVFALSFGQENPARFASPEHREWVLQQAAAQTQLTVEQVEAGLYADLDEARVLGSLGELSPQSLLERYNLALAQGLLLQASELQVWVNLDGELAAARYRQLFRYLKFFRLLHDIKRENDGGYHIRLDGPLSLFKSSPKYGLQLASFLPALLLCDGWRAEARVRWHQSELRFVFDCKEGLRSHYRDRGVYLSEEHRSLERRLSELKTQWTWSHEPSLLELGGQELWIPDYRFVHPDGRVAYVELIGYWRRAYLERRLELLRHHGPSNLLLVVSERLRLDELEKGEKGAQSGARSSERLGSATIMTFKRTILARALLETIDHIAIASEQPTVPPPSSSARTRRRSKAPDGSLPGHELSAPEAPAAPSDSQVKGQRKGSKGPRAQSRKAEDHSDETKQGRKREGKGQRKASTRRPGEAENDGKTED